ncbi:discoidin domain-containing protein [Plantibacter sp. Mn2098]|uniref:discoidin domain-containing protein n=1 Tax=Plantibacter sp. Mn2098 TaxID=3395266 RepID=UPI003BBD6352
MKSRFSRAATPAAARGTAAPIHTAPTHAAPSRTPFRAAALGIGIVLALGLSAPATANAGQLPGAAAAGTTAAATAAASSRYTLPPLVIYVSPTAKGLQLGTKARPFGSLERAKQAVRLLNKHMITDIEVRLLDGTYRLDKPFELTARDSGSNGHTITYAAAPGATPIISGGTQVTGWQLSDPARGIYRAHVGKVDTRQLYVDGEPATRARSGDNPGGFSKNATGYTITDPAYQHWGNQRDVEVVSSWGWKLQRCLVESISATAMTIQQPCWNNANLQEGQEIQNPSWIENAYELLDSPGEWYLDKAKGDLFYKPKDGQDLSVANVTIPKAPSLVDLTGTIGKPVHDVAFSGLTFSHSTWLEPSSPDGLIEGQAGFRMVGAGNPTFDSTRLNWKKTPGAVNVSYGHKVSFTGNTFTHLGAVGLNLNTGTQGTTITGNVFTDIAGTGLQIGGTDIVDHHPTDKRSVTKDTTVRNNFITDIATNYRGSVGILAGYTDNTVIEHNRIKHVPYSGISVGWGWGLTDKGGNVNYPTNGGIPIYDTDTPSRHTIVRYNWISDIMRSQADGGAIYTLSRTPDSEVSGNYITDVPHSAYGAIYHDEASSGFKNFNNAFCNIDFQWLLVNHGIGLDVQRNIATTPRFSTQGNTIDTTVANNTTVESCEQMPASIVANAGLEAAYRHLDPVEAPADQTAPSAPGAASAEAAFLTVADLSWGAAQDDTGVTGYSVFADGKLVSASKDPAVRLTGLTAGASYVITVTARDAAGNESAPSEPATITMPDGSDLAKGKPVTASSYSEPNTPELAVDGDLSTRWAQAIGYPDPSWIQVDLGSNQDVSGVITTFELATGYKYRLEASTDEMNWTTIEDHTGQATTVPTNYSIPEHPVTGRYVRLSIVGTNGNGGSIYGLEVYGTPSAPSGDTQAPSAPGKPTADILLPSVLDLGWAASTDDVGVTSYAVYDGDTRIALTTEPTFRVTGLKPGSEHSFTVIARDAALNESARSEAVPVTMPADTSLTTGKQVTASSFSEPNTPDKLVDGDLGTRWAQGIGLSDPSWVQVDLGAATQVKSVVATFELPSGYRYRLETSLDGQTWTTFDDRTADKTTQRTNYSFQGEAVSARYLRLTVVDSSWNGGSLWELQAYGQL